MSDVNGACKFNDGSTMYCIFQGSIGIMFPHLAKTINEVWDYYESSSTTVIDDRHISCKHEPELVKLYGKYGGGYLWEAIACKKCEYIIEGNDADHEGHNYKNCYETHIDFEMQQWVKEVLKYFENCDA